MISAAAAERAVAVGHQLTMLNRGNTALRAIPPGVELLSADIRDTASVRTALGDRSFNVLRQYTMWSAVVLEPAFPGRRVAASISWVLSHHTLIGW